ncbi:unnamed protein product [Bursaphelenchus xylophilus]|uniref:(pine wood nematode) hypothetical protein n=1 Tax=Bursaphelenchus xylophilus TaxID=6326 RepID=A0A1I7RMG9_BURXY|nr:unnamed protein product [Bursaphelenchus xylophilus]CAG9118477.1 unnamed protein product [Bursaphelenchus xylophilus]
MAGYARLLKIHAFIDLYYCIVNVATSVEPFPYGGYFYLVPTGFLRHVDNRHWWIFFFAVYYNSILAEMSISPVDFYYRYRDICRTPKWRNLAELDQVNAGAKQLELVAAQIPGPSNDLEKPGQGVDGPL